MRILLVIVLLNVTVMNAMISPRLEWVLEYGTQEDFSRYCACEKKLSRDDMNYALQCMGRKRCACGMLALIENGACAYEYDENIFTNAVRAQDWRLIGLLLSKKALVSVDAIEYLCLYNKARQVCSVLSRVPKEARNVILREARRRGRVNILEFVRNRRNYVMHATVRQKLCLPKFS